jgi:hypothetical protein
MIDDIRSPAHGHAQNGSEMIDTERLGYQLVLEIDHVAMAVIRKVGRPRQELHRKG